MEEFTFTIPIEPKSKKNSQMIVHAKGGREYIVPSPYYKKYERQCGEYMPWPKEPISRPVNVKAVFFKKTRQRCDLVNLQEALLDVLVKYRVLEDDKYTIVYSMDGSRVMYDKMRPRTEVTITPVDDVWFGNGEQLTLKEIADLELEAD